MAFDIPNGDLLAKISYLSFGSGAMRPYQRLDMQRQHAQLRSKSFAMSWATNADHQDKLEQSVTYKDDCIAKFRHTQWKFTHFFIF